MNDLGRVTIEHRDHVVIAAVDGELDLSNWEHVGEAVEAAVNSDDTGLVVDLGPTSYFDSTGVRLVFRLAERLKARRQGFALVIGGNQIVQRVTELTGIKQCVDCHHTVDQAVTSLSSPR